MTDHITIEAARRAHAILGGALPSERRQDSDPFTALRRRVSLPRIIERAQEQRRFEGAEGEYLHETAHRFGKLYDQSRPIIDWELLAPATQQRDASVAGSGGYLVSTSVSAAADALRPTTVALQLGATGMDAVGNLSVPRQTGVAPGTWLTGEGVTATEGNQTFGQLALSPKTVGAYTEVSRLLLLQSNADAIIKRDLLAVIGRAIDLAALHGTGLNGQPTGITNTSGIGSFSGTSLALTGLVDAFVGLGDGLGTHGGVAASRTVAGTLRKRAENSGSTRTLWDGALTDGTVIGYPGRSSTAVAAGNLIIGSWEKLLIPVWGGLELMVNPYGDPTSAPQNFQKGIVGMRCFATVDVGITYPSAFALAATVT